LRKLTAISFILILLVNLGGYRLIIAGMQSKADSRLESYIDNSRYEESQLIELRVPLNMPYQERYTEFERHYGEITIDGQAYTYVKRKIEGGVLVLKCIANKARQELKKVNDDQAKNNSAQQPQSSGKKQNSFAKIFSGDFDDKSPQFNLSVPAASENMYDFNYTSSLNDVLIKTPHQPPRPYHS
jgi:hypothetical protein